VLEAAPLAVANRRLKRALEIVQQMGANGTGVGQLL
jgi:hypothetical protein